MKTRILTVALLAFGVSLFAQKREVKKALKALDDKNYTKAMNELNEAEAEIASADAELQSEYYYALGYATLGNTQVATLQQAEKATAAFKKSMSLQESEFAKNGMLQAANVILTKAQADIQKKDFKGAAEKFYMTYQLSPQDTVFLYNAAGSATNAKAYDQALKYYLELEDLGYDGSETEFYAIQKDTGEEVQLSEQDRKLGILSGDYIKPTEKQTGSKRPEVVKNIALIYIQQDKTEEAMAAIETAKQENPDDISLLQTEADIYYELGDLEKYKAIMETVAERNPNNAQVMYNLGVSTGQLGDSQTAIDYFKKAVEIDPDFTDAKINIAAEILRKEKPLIEKMNALGTSSADFKKYDEYQEQRNQIYREAVPYLTDVLDNNPDNVEATRTLMNIYNQIGEEAKAKKMRTKLESLEGN